MLPEIIPTNEGYCFYKLLRHSFTLELMILLNEIEDKSIPLNEI